MDIIEKPKLVSVKFRNNNDKINESKEDSLELYHFKTFHVNTDVFMRNLLYSIQRFKIPISVKKISCLYEIPSKIVFNCTGLGSRELNNDKDIYPICGHGFKLNINQVDKSIKKDDGSYNYIIRLNKLVVDKDNEGPIYFMPKTSGFIGGSYIRDYAGGDRARDSKIFNEILERAKLLFHGDAPIKQEFKPKF
jgi:hypothetical protein